MYRVETTAQFDDDLRRLDRATAARIIERIAWLAEHPEALRFPLKHLPRELRGLHKYRVGDYRILMWVNHGGPNLNALRGGTPQVCLPATGLDSVGGMKVLSANRVMARGDCPRFFV